MKGRLSKPAGMTDESAYAVVMKLVLCALLACGIAGRPARAATSAPMQTPRMTARLITDVDSTEPGRPFHAALELIPAPGWHTYWHNPGDAGAAPDWTLTQPAGVLLGQITWPLPQRLADGSIMSFAYTQGVLLTRLVTLSGKAAHTLTVEANWLVCRTVCIPEQARFTVQLPEGPMVASPEAPLFAAAAAQLPQPSPWPAHVAPDGTVWLTGAAGLPAPVVFLPDESDTTVLGAAQPVQRSGGVLSIHLTPTASFHPHAQLRGVLIAGAGADRLGFSVQAEPGSLPSNAGLPITTLLLAFAGGLLLNVMPCVFPVLAMKALGLSALAGAARGRIRGHALATTAGVLISFAALAGLLLALRAAGSAAGWGFQFQFPAFVALMAWLFFVIGLNLSGWFEFGGSWAGLGQSLAARDGLAGSFATGLLAVVVATPCTAPFMGVAVAAAAAAPPPVAVAVFIALGLGFALPWLILAAWPGLAARLPAPGRWMEWLRQGLAFPMFATCVWLVWVQSRQTGSSGVLAVGTGFVLIAAAIWVSKLAAMASGRARLGGRMAAAALGLLVLAILPAFGQAAAPLPATEAGAEPFSADRLAALRARRRPVLVNLTASWCVTCLVNERAVLHAALPGLAARGVAYLVGDWTLADPAIGAFLRQYGREGVPLYVFFAAAQPSDQPGRVLPQILTPGMIAQLGAKPDR